MDNKVHPLFPHHLIPLDRNYKIENKELLVIKLTIGLKGQRFLLWFWTDHKNPYIRTAQNLNSLPVS